MNRKKAISLILGISIISTTCMACGKTQESFKKTENKKSSITVYHAGSLEIPFAEIEKKFEKEHPDIDVKRTSGGSRDLARKVTELGNKVDALASADYQVIDNLMMPKVAKWDGLFAKNSMVIMYTDKSKYAKDINEKNWYDILLKDGVNYGHSDPNADPCGYRTLLLWNLSEKYYKKDGLYKKLNDKCPSKNVQSKSVGLISKLETGTLDYAFEYESVARQHAAKNSSFKYVKLPDNINLSSLKYKDFYETASVKLNGKKPGEVVVQKGSPIIYGITMPNTGENKEDTIEFLKFLFDKEKGRKILEDNGQPTLNKIQINGEKNLPKELKEAVTIK